MIPLEEQKERWDHDKMEIEEQEKLLMEMGLGLGIESFVAEFAVFVHDFLVQTLQINTIKNFIRNNNYGDYYNIYYSNYCVPELLA